ncbi:hypothetical protein LJC69_03420 [Bacteroidales bacterium OttesenSCG-928-K22]|nr:hypothetical protein [Bacteroidales bacterium OttesenSCG-928-K22]
MKKLILSFVIAILAISSYSQNDFLKPMTTAVVFSENAFSDNCDVRILVYHKDCDRVLVDNNYQGYQLNGDHCTWANCDGRGSAYISLIVSYSGVVSYSATLHYNENTLFHTEYNYPGLYWQIAIPVPNGPDPD